VTTKERHEDQKVEKTTSRQKCHRRQSSLRYTNFGGGISSLFVRPRLFLSRQSDSRRLRHKYQPLDASPLNSRQSCAPGTAGDRTPSRSNIGETRQHKGREREERFTGARLFRQIRSPDGRLYRRDEGRWDFGIKNTPIKTGVISAYEVS